MIWTILRVSPQREFSVAVFLAAGRQNIWQKKGAR